jgi:bifunctional DNase/RNase
MSEMIEVVIDSVRVSLMSPQRLVVLRQVDSERYLPIWVGPYEAESITVALQEIEMIRPLTHDLLKNLFNTFNTRIKRVEIVALREDIFYGNIVAEAADGTTINIDSRPSDAIALAVRSHVPILVHPSVMDTAGIVPEDDIRSQMPPAPGLTERPRASIAPAETPAPAAPTAPRSSASPDDARLSIFEDFLKKIDKDKPEDDKPLNN